MFLGWKSCCSRGAAIVNSNEFFAIGFNQTISHWVYSKFYNSRLNMDSPIPAINEAADGNEWNCAKESKKVSSTEGVMSIVFWGFSWCCSYLEQSRTITKKYHVSKCTNWTTRLRLSVQIWSKRNLEFLLYNSMTYTSKYLSDLTHSDYLLFSNLKKWHAGDLPQIMREEQRQTLILFS